MIVSCPWLSSLRPDGPIKRRRELAGGPAPKRPVLHHVPFVPVGNKCNVLVSVCSINTQTPSQKQLFPPHTIDTALHALPHGSVEPLSVPIMAAQCFTSMSRFLARVLSFTRARHQSMSFIASNSDWRDLASMSVPRRMESYSRHFVLGAGHNRA